MQTELPEIPSDFTSFSMRELVEWFNENAMTRDRVKSFRTLAVGVTRCKAMADQIEAQRQFERDTENMTDEELTRYAFGDLDPAEEERNHRERRAKRLIESNRPKTGAGSKKSAGITESWKDDETHKRRTTRNRVTVEYNGKTEEFRSVREAFELLGLPMEPHIRFRGKLKREGTKVFTHNGETFMFRVVYRKEEGE